MATQEKRYPLGAIHMTSAEVWQTLGVRADLLRQWATRNHILKVGRDLYDMGSVMSYVAKGSGEDGE
jgi:hypothetical protein